ACLSLNELDDLAGLARQKGVQLVIVNPDHFLPSRRLIRQQLDAGKLGEPGLVRIHRWEPAAPDSNRPLVRDLELAAWLVGKPPSLVYALGQGALDENAPGGRFVHVQLGFPGGATALIDHAECLPAGAGYQ